MDLEKSVARYIAEEAKKLALRHHAYHNAIAIENKRKLERTKSPKLLQVEKPEHWSIDRKFDPFYVKKNTKSIARSIAKKITTYGKGSGLTFDKVILMVISSGSHG